MNKGAYVINLEKLLRDCGYTAIEYSNSDFILTLGSGGFNASNAAIWRSNIAAASLGRTSSVFFNNSSFFRWPADYGPTINNFIVKRIYSSSESMTVYCEHPKSQTNPNFRFTITNSDIVFYKS